MVVRAVLPGTGPVIVGLDKSDGNSVLEISTFINDGIEHTSTVCAFLREANFKLQPPLIPNLYPRP